MATCPECCPCCLKADEMERERDALRSFFRVDPTIEVVDERDAIRRRVLVLREHQRDMLTPAMFELLGSFLTVIAQADVLQQQRDEARAERDHLASRLEPLDCGSCGGSIVPNDPDGFTCRGCGLIVCETCSTVFDHLGNGAHASGDPREAVDAMRRALLPTAEQPGAAKGE
jgi:hypothetical protein